MIVARLRGTSIRTRIIVIALCLGSLSWALQAAQLAEPAAEAANAASAGGGQATLVRLLQHTFAGLSLGSILVAVTLLVAVLYHRWWGDGPSLYDELALLTFGLLYRFPKHCARPFALRV